MDSGLRIVNRTRAEHQKALELWSWWSWWELGRSWGRTNLTG